MISVCPFPCYMDHTSTRCLSLTPFTDALDYDKECDASLPLESILSRDEKLRKLLSDLDRKFVYPLDLCFLGRLIQLCWILLPASKVRVIALTNAYKTHATRVLEILGVIDLIEALVFCDYGRPDKEFGCKPEPGFFKEVRLPFFSEPKPR